MLPLSAEACRRSGLPRQRDPGYATPTLACVSVGAVANQSCTTVIAKAGLYLNRTEETQHPSLEYLAKLVAETYGDQTSGRAIRDGYRGRRWSTAALPS